MGQVRLSVPLLHRVWNVRDLKQHLSEKAFDSERIFFLSLFLPPTPLPLRNDVKSPQSMINIYVQVFFSSSASLKRLL